MRLRSSHAPRRWEVAVIATKPYAQSVTRHYRDEPTTGQVEDFMHDTGAKSASVFPPIKSGATS